MKRVFSAMTLISLLGACAQEPLALKSAVKQENIAVKASDQLDLIRRAFFYTLPIHEMGMIRSRVLGDGVSPGKATINKWDHNRKLLSPDYQPVTGPNNDTIYSSTWIDLANGPVKLSTPDTNGRYFSVAVFDANTNAIDVLGRRKSGTRAADYVIVGPRWTSPLPDGVQVIRATTDDTFLLVRILVDGEDDMKNVAPLQDQFSVTPIGASATIRPIWSHSVAGPEKSAEHYLNLVNEMLSRNAPPPYESSYLQTFAQIGICGAECSWDKLSPEIKQLWTDSLPKLYTGLRDAVAAARPRSTGWTVNRRLLGDWGTDYPYRAAVALVGILGLPPGEAMYSHGRFDSEGRKLDGTHKYILHLPPGGVPADAFWSLSMYKEDEDGRHWFIRNPIKRNSIGDRTPGLKLNKDGSLDILLQSEKPKSGAENWLPAPNGPFLLSMRAYQPKAEYLDGRFKLPAIQRLD